MTTFINLDKPPAPEGVHRRLLEAMSAAGKTFDDVARDTVLDRDMLREQERDLNWDSFTVRVIADYLGVDGFKIQTGFSFHELGDIVARQSADRARTAI